jgi:uncharacterized membrane protein
LIGTSASVVAGLLMGLLAFGMASLQLHLTSVDGAVPPQWPIVPLCVAAAFGGSLLDSILGVVLEYSAMSSRIGMVCRWIAL